MGKDREGRYHPPKGKPSDTSKEGELGLRRTMEPEDLDKDMKMTEKYTEGGDKLASNVHMRHPNRQTRKGKDKYKAKEEGSSKTWKEETYAQDRVDTAPTEMYGVLTKDLLRELSAFRSSCSITIVIPTHRAGMQVNEQEDVIRFKNMLQDLKNELEEQRMDALTIEKILEPGFELMRNENFWHYQSDGLAVFMAENYFRYVKLPFTPPQQRIVNNTFHLINLLPLLNTDTIEKFYLLLMRRDAARLYKADAQGIHEVQVEDMPENITEVINYEGDEDAYMETHTGENTDTPEQLAPGRPEKATVELYVKKIEAAFQKAVPEDDSWPVMLAGQADLREAFRKRSLYKIVMDAELDAEDEYEDIHSLFDRSRKKLLEKSEEQVDKRLETYYNNTTGGLTTSIPADAIPASYYGQVRTLFVEKGAHIWGHFNEMNNELHVHVQRQQDDDCLVDRAAVQTILHGGEVFILDKEKMPKDATLAALLRYSV